MYYTRFKTELCEVILVGDENGLKQLELNTEENKRPFRIESGWNRDDSFFGDLIIQIHEYFSGSRKNFNVKLAAEGTEFQKRVWAQLLKIPYGETRSYGEIAAAIGNPAASRAVGAANGRNPVSLIVPCHRVIGISGKLTGYAHGLKAKQWLLEHEKTSNLLKPET